MKICDLLFADEADGGICECLLFDGLEVCGVWWERKCFIGWKMDIRADDNVDVDIVVIS